MLKRKEFMLGAVAGLTVAAAATAGGVIDWPAAEAGPVAGASGRLTPNNGGLAFAPPQGAPLSFADIFQQVAPAVVQIDVRSRVQRPRAMQIPGLPPLPLPDNEDGGEEDEGATAMGAGSGFFISADGYIVTNNHVVADAVEITVRLADERELPARVIGRDEATDLAVIKVDGTNFPFVSFEEEAAPRVGDWVIAVGNPFGLGGTATAGIVSAMGRGVDSAYVDYLQIDAAINRGNSGGPTFDIYGRVIGVNSSIYSETGGSVGIGFAIPASVAKPITDRLMRGESISRGYVGLALQSFNADQWEAAGQARDFKGAYVMSVTEGGPADQAGVQVGDFLTSVNGRAVDGSSEATREVGRARPGDTIRLGILRNGRAMTLNVRSGTRPSESELLAQQDGGAGPRTPGQPAVPQGETIEGLTVSALTATLRSRYDVPDDVNGVIITEIQRGSAASGLGLVPGLVVTRVDNRDVTTPAELRAAVEAVKRAGRPSVLLFIRTPQGTVPVPLKFNDE